MAQNEAAGTSSRTNNHIFIINNHGDNNQLKHSHRTSPPINPKAPKQVALYQDDVALYSDIPILDDDIPNLLSQGEPPSEPHGRLPSQPHQDVMDEEAPHHYATFITKPMKEVADEAVLSFTKVRFAIRNHTKEHENLLSCINNQQVPDNLPGFITKLITAEQDTDKRFHIVNEWLQQRTATLHEKITKLRRELQNIKTDATTLLCDMVDDEIAQSNKTIVIENLWVQKQAHYYSLFIRNEHKSNMQKAAKVQARAEHAQAREKVEIERWAAFEQLVKSGKFTNKPQSAPKGTPKRPPKQQSSKPPTHLPSRESPTPKKDIKGRNHPNAQSGSRAPRQTTNQRSKQARLKRHA